jgi:hypothetical protein
MPCDNVLTLSYYYSQDKFYLNKILL